MYTEMKCEWIPGFGGVGGGTPRSVHLCVRNDCTTGRLGFPGFSALVAVIDTAHPLVV